MIKISAFPKCWIDHICDGRMELSEWIELSRQLECDGLELYGGFLKSYESAYLDGIREHVERCGMTISMICHSPDFTIPEAAGREAEIAGQHAIIRVSRRLGCKFVRVLSGQKRPGLAVDAGIRLVVDCIRRCLPVAEENGVVLAMENHYKDGSWLYPEFAQRMEVFLAIVEQIHSPHFGIQFDPSNTLVAGENPLDLLERVADRVVTMHASDRYVLDGHDREEVLRAAGASGYHPALQHGVTGRGLNDYPTIFSKLAAVGFDGWISIEDGMNGMDEMRESVDFLKKMRDRYFPAK